MSIRHISNDSNASLYIASALGVIGAAALLTLFVVGMLGNFSVIPIPYTISYLLTMSAVIPLLSLIFIAKHKDKS